MSSLGWAIIAHLHLAWGSHSPQPHVAYVTYLCHLLGLGTLFELVVPANGSESPSKFLTKWMSSKTPWGKLRGWIGAIRVSSAFVCVLCATHCARHGRGGDEYEESVYSVTGKTRNTKFRLLQKFNHQWGLRLDNKNIDKGVNAKHMLKEFLWKISHRGQRRKNVNYDCVPEEIRKRGCKQQQYRITQSAVKVRSRVRAGNENRMSGLQRDYTGCAHPSSWHTSS